MTTATVPQWQGARHSTALMPTTYLGIGGRLAFNVRSRGEVRRTIRQWLRVARTPAERRRVLDVWRHVHYLGRGAGNVFPPRTIRLSYFLDLPSLRPAPHPWYPAAAATLRFALPGGVPAHLGLQSPLQAVELARFFVCDDLRYPTIPDLAPAVLREVVRRMRHGGDWVETVRGRVKWQPKWLITFSDPTVGHDGGLYRGAGAEYLGQLPGGKDVWGWPL